MTPETIFADLIESGIDPGLTPDKTGIVVPAGKLTQKQREAVLEHKATLIQYLIESSRITTRLMVAAMRRCDEFSDSDKAREEMRQDVLATPLHLRKDLLDHFDGKPSNFY